MFIGFTVPTIIEPQTATARQFLPREAAIPARLSVRQFSVCHAHACFVTKRKNLLPIFLYSVKEQSL